MAERNWGPRRGIYRRPDDLEIRLPGHRIHGQDPAPGRAHDDYAWKRDNGRQDEGHAYGFVRHNRRYDDGDRPAERPGLPSQDTAGGFRGLGPRGYRRSDARIREDLCDRLTDEDTIDARGISVEVAQGRVTLAGHVGSPRMKRAAGLCAAECAGVAEVRNDLHVRGE